jgi:hypothetical protein
MTVAKPCGEACPARSLGNRVAARSPVRPSWPTRSGIFRAGQFCGYPRFVNEHRALRIEVRMGLETGGLPGGDAAGRACSLPCTVFLKVIACPPAQPSLTRSTMTDRGSNRT